MTETEYIEMLMQNLHCTEEAARDVMETDRAIDRGADPFPLTAEQKATEKKMRQGKRAPTAYKFQPRERKPNEAKRNIIDALNSFLVDFVHEYDEDCLDDDVFITNPERQIDFTLKGVRYRVVLSAPRK